MENNLKSNIQPISLPLEEIESGINSLKTLINNKCKLDSTSFKDFNIKANIFT